MARRPQINTDLGGPEALRTTARPLGSSTFVAQVAPSRGAALAQALSSIKPELNAFVKDVHNEFREAEENRAYDTIQGMTYDQSQALIKSGDLRATESPWYQAAFEKQFGLAHAARRRREVLDRYTNGFDKEAGDVDSFLTDFAADDAEAYGDNPHIMSGLREGMAGVFKTVKDEHAQWQSETTRQKASDQFLDVARGAFDKATAEGANPMEAIGALYGPHRKMLGLTYAEMDDYVVQLAEERAAAGDVAGAKAILEYDRVADDGTKVGSFTGRANFSLKAQQIIETAKATDGDNIRAEHGPAIAQMRLRSQAGNLDARDRAKLQNMVDLKVISPEMHESLLVGNAGAASTAAAAGYDKSAKSGLLDATMETLRMGRGYTLQDQKVVNPVTGKETSYSTRELIKEAATQEVNTMLAHGAAPAVVAQHMAEWGVDYTYEPFANAMSYGFMSLTEAVAKAGKDGPKIAEPAIAGYQTWKALANQPRLRDAHVKDATAGQVYRDASALERIGVPVEDALLRAASIDRKNGRTALASQVDRKEFYSAVVKATEGTAWTGGGNGVPTAMNNGQVAQWIEESVRVQMDLGVPMSVAVDEGLKAFKESHVVVNGVAVNARNNFLPSNFSGVSTAVVKDYAAANNLEADDLTLYPTHDGSDYWILVYKDNLMPAGEGAGGGRFHISQLQQTYLDDYNMRLANARIQKEAERRKRVEEFNAVVNMPLGEAIDRSDRAMQTFLNGPSAAKQTEKSENE